MERIEEVLRKAIRKLFERTEGNDNPVKSSG